MLVVHMIKDNVYFTDYSVLKCTKYLFLIFKEKNNFFIYVRFT